MGKVVLFVFKGTTQELVILFLFIVCGLFSFLIQRKSHAKFIYRI